VCDGFHVHPFHTIDYLDRVVIPKIQEGAESAGRRLADVELISTVFVVTGRDDAEMERATRAVKGQIAFYASTPSYRAVLETHGWDFGPTLSSMSRRGEWSAMADVIPDEVVDQVAVVAERDQLGPAVKARYGDRIARVGFYNLDGAPRPPDEELAAAIAHLQQPS
jgi:alkanesulfonate monooxygenase SsuD/methylene tetrahydromethanopterin reductase-like flavin-dependent oxidoreductase (luciferase family)